MSIPDAYKYKEGVQYPAGGFYNPSHQFSLVNQRIVVKSKKYFIARFPNIWSKYKLPRVDDAEVYANWISNQMQFWQNQLNFALWCATTGCGVGKKHLRHTNPMIRSVFRFHAYYQIRRILSEMSCPLPNESVWNAVDNMIDMVVYERICKEYNIKGHTSFRQRLDDNNGVGTAKFTRTYHHDFSLKTDTGVEVAKKPNLDNFTEFVPGHVNFLGNSKDATYKIFIDQSFHKESGYVDYAPDGTWMAAIGTFVDDASNGFTQAGVVRVDDSIRTYVWAILSAQSMTKSSILGTGTAFDAQKQFMTNVEDAINSAVDLPSSIYRYQNTLQ